MPLYIYISPFFSTICTQETPYYIYDHGKYTHAHTYIYIHEYFNWSDVGSTLTRWVQVLAICLLGLGDIVAVSQPLVIKHVYINTRWLITFPHPFKDFTSDYTMHIIHVIKSMILPSILLVSLAAAMPLVERDDLKVDVDADVDVGGD